MGLLFFGRELAAGADAAALAGGGGESFGRGAYLRTKLRSLYKTSLDNSSISSSISSS